jgi:hypothetical protein
LDVTKELDFKYKFMGSILVQSKDACVEILDICQERVAILSNELTEVGGARIDILVLIRSVFIPNKEAWIKMHTGPWNLLQEL